MKTNAKSDTILDIALQLLKNEGDYALSMRRVASNAGMSLSNLQYYYKNKDALLTAMADRYFNACLEQMRAMPPICSKGASEDIYALLKVFLAHGLEVSEMCRIFREYWAISTRNKVIDEYLKQYYQQVVNILSDLLRPAARTERSLSRAISIIVPFTEGYSITALSMPEDIHSITEDMAAIILRLLADN